MLCPSSRSPGHACGSGRCSTRRLGTCCRTYRRTRRASVRRPNRSWTTSSRTSELTRRSNSCSGSPPLPSSSRSPPKTRKDSFSTRGGIRPIRCGCGEPAKANMPSGSPALWHIRAAMNSPSPCRHHGLLRLSPRRARLPAHVRTGSVPPIPTGLIPREERRRQVGWFDVAALPRSGRCVTRQDRPDGRLAHIRSGVAMPSRYRPWRSTRAVSSHRASRLSRTSVSARSTGHCSKNRLNAPATVYRWPARR